MFHNIQNNGKEYIGWYRLVLSLYVFIAELANEYASILVKKIYMQFVVVLEHETPI